jgi:hypothetical protein
MLILHENDLMPREWPLTKYGEMITILPRSMDVYIANQESILS